MSLVPEQVISLCSNFSILGAGLLWSFFVKTLMCFPERKPHPPWVSILSDLYVIDQAVNFRQQSPPLGSASYLSPGLAPRSTIHQHLPSG